MSGTPRSLNDRVQVLFLYPYSALLYMDVSPAVLLDYVDHVSFPPLRYNPYNSLIIDLLCSLLISVFPLAPTASAGFHRAAYLYSYPALPIILGRRASVQVDRLSSTF